MATKWKYSSLAIANYSSGADVLRRVEQDFPSETHHPINFVFALKDWAKSISTKHRLSEPDVLKLELLSHHLSQATFSIDAILESQEVELQELRDSGLVEGDLARVRGWIKALVWYARDETKITTGAKHTLDKIMGEHRDLIAVAFEKEPSQKSFIESLKDTYLKKYAGMFFAIDFANEIKAWAKENTKNGKKIDTKTFHSKLFDEVDEALFEIPGFWDQFNAEMLSQHGEHHLNQFNPISGGFRYMHMTEIVQELAEKYPELNALIAADKGLTTLNFITVAQMCSKKTAMDTFKQIFEIRAKGFDKDFAHGVDEILGLVEGIVKDRNALGSLFFYPNFSAIHSGTNYLATRGAKKSFEWADRSFPDATKGGCQLTEIYNELNRVFPGLRNKAKRSAAADILADLYSPATGMNSHEHSSLVYDVRTFLKGLSKVPAQVRGLQKA